MKDQVISPQGIVENPFHGIMLDMTEAEYRKAPGLNHSSLKHMEKNPLEFQYQLTAPRKPPSEAMAFGLYLEWLIETRGEVDVDGSKFAIQPEGHNGRTTQGKEWKKEQLENGKTIITQKMDTDAHGQLEMVKQRPIWDVISKAEIQVPVFAVIEVGGVKIQVKILLDLLAEDMRVMDFKTTTDCGEKFWDNHVLKMFYHTQAAWYTYILHLVTEEEPKPFTHIVMEKEPPYHSMCWELSEHHMRLGRRTIWQWVYQYVECYMNDDWPGYDTKPKELSMNPWKKKQMENNNEHRSRN